MTDFFAQIDAWLIAVLLGAAMFGAWAVGRWRGRELGTREQAKEGDAPSKRLSDAILALLGLLLAFTFAMSLGKHDQRRLMLLADSNAMGDFYTSVSLLKDPEVRGKLQAVIREYVELHLSFAKGAQDEATLQSALKEVQKLHDRMQALVYKAVNDGTPVVVPLVNTLNAVTSSHAARLAAGRDHLPGSIVLLLFLAAVVSMGLMGWQQGQASEFRVGATIGFAMLVCMAVWVTLDLNQPRRGLITISQEPLERLLMDMDK